MRSKRARPPDVDGFWRPTVKPNDRELPLTPLPSTFDLREPTHTIALRHTQPDMGGSIGGGDLAGLAQQVVPGSQIRSSPASA
jgi:hypothetical protein